MDLQLKTISSTSPFKGKSNNISNFVCRFVDEKKMNEDIPNKLMILFYYKVNKTKPSKYSCAAGV